MSKSLVLCLPAAPPHCHRVKPTVMELSGPTSVAPVSPILEVEDDDIDVMKYMNLNVS